MRRDHIYNIAHGALLLGSTQCAPAAVRFLHSFAQIWRAGFWQVSSQLPAELSCLPRRTRTSLHNSRKLPWLRQSKALIFCGVTLSTCHWLRTQPAQSVCSCGPVWRFLIDVALAESTCLAIICTSQGSRTQSKPKIVSFQQPHIQDMMQRPRQVAELLQIMS